jgi:hypothetical protein
VVGVPAVTHILFVVASSFMHERDEIALELTSSNVMISERLDEYLL